MSFYTGAKFPDWKNNLFVTSMIRGRIPGTGHLQRVVFNENGEIRREMLLTELRQRIRLVQQGPDELLYVLTDENDGALLRIEPSTAEQFNQWAVTAGNAVSAVLPQGPDPLNDAPLFAGQDCRACHSTSVNQVGPAYINIARRYDATDANRISW